MSEKPTVLVLAGTKEARDLLVALKGALPEHHFVASFAGAVANLPDLDVEKRIGGFGGASGMVSYIDAENVVMVVDATHPYASIISGNAVIACNNAKVPLVRLERAAWVAGETDDWTSFPNISALVEALPEGCNPFLATGHKDLGMFLHRKDMKALVRTIEAPKLPLPEGWTLVQSRPQSDPEAEAELLKKHGITHIVCKNSGGTASFAKLDAARELEIPVFMLDRPKLAPADSHDSVESLVAKVEELLSV